MMKALVTLSHSRFRLFLPIPALTQMILMLFMARFGRPSAKIQAPDWILHATAYFVLCILAWIAYHGLFPRSDIRAHRLPAVIITLVFAFVDEAVQSTTPARTAELADIAADAAGTVLAWFAISLALHVKLRLDAPRHR